MRRFITPLAAVLLLVLFGVAVRAGAGTFISYYPLYTPERNQTWRPLAVVNKPSVLPNGVVWERMYTKQANQTTFRLCGLFMGQGEVALTYPGVGDPYDFDYEVPTPLCIDTVVGSGGGTLAFPLQVWLIQRGNRPASITNPNIFVGEQH